MLENKKAQMRLSIIDKLRQKGVPGGIGPFPEPMAPENQAPGAEDLSLAPDDVLPAMPQRKKKAPPQAY